MLPQYKYPEDQAVRIWQKDDVQLSIVKVDIFRSDETYNAVTEAYRTSDLTPPRRFHYCGYCRFPFRPFRGEEDSLFSYVQVHGGITYVDEDPDGTTVYGFDCAHADDENNPQTADIEWVANECEYLAHAVKKALQLEPYYRACTNDEDRKQVIEKYYQMLQP